MKNLLLILILSCFSVNAFSVFEVPNGPPLRWEPTTIKYAIAVPAKHRRMVRLIVRQAFKDWAKASNSKLKFRETMPFRQPPINIVWLDKLLADNMIDDPRILAQTVLRGLGSKLTWVTIHINARDYDWHEGAPWFEKNSGLPKVDLTGVMLHEIGHLVGLAHSNVNCACMRPYIHETTSMLKDDDRAGVRWLYLPREETRDLTPFEQVIINKPEDSF